MKKLLMIVALVGMALTGYSKTSDSSVDARAQKPTITLYVTGSAFYRTITLHASQPVPEPVYCEGNYQAPMNVTGYWSATLMPGETSVTVSSDITEDNFVDLGLLNVGGETYRLEFETGPFETASAIYYVR